MSRSAKKTFSDSHPSRRGGKIAEEFSIIEEISAEDFGYTEDEMAMRYCLPPPGVLLHRRKLQ